MSSSAAEPPKDAIEVTPRMIDAAERAMLDYAKRFNIVSLDEMHGETFRQMIAAALSKARTP